MTKGKIFIIVWTFILFNINVDQVRAQEKPELDYVPGELLVRFAPTKTGMQLDTAGKNVILSSLGGATIKHNFRIVPGLSLINLPENQKVEDVLYAYNANEGILYAEPNYKLKYLNEPNDPYFLLQWGLHNTGQSGGTNDADIDAPEAWEIRTNVDPNIIVALIDSGVDYYHPDLTENMWINEAEIYA